MKYFQLYPRPGPYWILNDETWHPALLDGTYYEGISPIYVPIESRGEEADVNLTLMYGLIVARDIVQRLHTIDARTMSVPTIVPGAVDDYAILVAPALDCVDERASLFRLWTHNDHRSDRAGWYREFERLVIDERAVRGHHLFRVARYTQALIVSEEVRSLFETPRSGVELVALDESPVHA